VWEAWYDHDAPETRLFPDYNERLDQFEKMLAVKRARRSQRGGKAAGKNGEHADRFSFTMQRKSMW